MAHSHKTLGSLLLALTLALGVTLPTGSAAACGGYRALDPDVEAIRSAALRSATGHRHRRAARFVATIVERTADRAVVHVRDVAPGAGRGHIEFEVSRTDSGWVVSSRTSAAVARR